VPQARPKHVVQRYSPGGVGERPSCRPAPLSLCVPRHPRGVLSCLLPRPCLPRRGEERRDETRNRLQCIYTQFQEAPSDEISICTLLYARNLRYCTRVIFEIFDNYAAMRHGTTVCPTRVPNGPRGQILYRRNATIGEHW